uniref:Chemosensory protein n=1 Tax=Glyphodes pyloalis TaxID=1242752 RepID=A0A6M3GVA7_GLYPY|nr:chemosensory protein [Glyphodes pyloalis]
MNMPQAYLFTIAMVTMVAADFYNPKYDEFDIQPLLENDRILMGYTKCFLDQGPCTPEAKDFKKAIPEALETSCGKCTPKQKELIKTVIRAMMESHPDSWTELVDKYDKDKKYRDNFNKFIESPDK